MTITIEEALCDKHLLGAAFGKPDTWGTWLTTLKAAFGNELTEDERHAFAAIARNREPPTTRVQELWTIAGRGSGKSRVSAVYCCVPCLLPAS